MVKTANRYAVSKARAAVIEALRVFVKQYNDDPVSAVEATIKKGEKCQCALGSRKFTCPKCGEDVEAVPDGDECGGDIRENHESDALIEVCSSDLFEHDMHELEMLLVRLDVAEQG